MEENVPGPSLQQQYDAARVHLMFQQTPSIFAGNLVVVPIFTYVLWGHWNHRELLTWAACTYALTAARAIYVWLYHRRAPAPGDALRWGWLFALTSAVSGCLWGTLGIVFFSPDDPVVLAIVCVVLSGMSGGSVASLSSFIPAYVMFAVPTILPMAVHSFWQGGTLYTAIGYLSLMLLAVNLAYSRNVQAIVRTSIRLRFQNLDLVESLRHEKEIAEAANHAKTRFLAAASHDLRQPTHAIGLFVGALGAMIRRGQMQPAPLQEVISKLQASVRGMTGLLGTLLDVSKLDAGIVVPMMRHVSIPTLFEQLRLQFSDEAAERDLRLVVRPCNATAFSDSELLRAIVSNLVSNAIRHTNRGCVMLACRRSGVGHHVIEVRDSGIGIAREDHARIFEEFVQLNNEARDREKGLGLGLSIVKRTAALLGHEVSLRSAPGRGSTFGIRLQTQLVTDEWRDSVAFGPSLPLAPLTPGRLRVILIDDDRSVLEATSALLAQHDCECLGAVSASSALDILDRTGIRPDLLIVDYRLSDGINGYSAIKQIRKVLQADVPAIIVTGDTSPERLRELSETGIPFFHKPIDAGVVENMLAKLGSAYADTKDSMPPRQGRLTAQG